MSFGSSTGRDNHPLQNKIYRRHSDEGERLPLIGIIADRGSEMPLTEMRSVCIAVGSENVTLRDGIYDGRWHVVFADREALTRFGSALPPIITLHLAGVSQLFSIQRATFDVNTYAQVMRITPEGRAFIDLTAAPDLSVSAVHSGCRRLKAALVESAHDTHVEILVPSMGAVLVSGASEERDYALANGICYASLEIVEGPGDGDLRRAGIAKILEAAPYAISPLGSCECSALRMVC